jgi:hypothetical protein
MPHVLQAFDSVEGKSATNATLMSKDCSNTFPESLFSVNGEYVNLYHTMTDWFNTSIGLPEFGSANVAGVVFLDAHPAGSLMNAPHCLANV